MPEISVTCPGCFTTFELDPEKLPDADTRASCSVCYAVITVTRKKGELDEAFDFPSESGTEEISDSNGSDSYLRNSQLLEDELRTSIPSNTRPSDVDSSQSDSLNSGSLNSENPDSLRANSDRESSDKESTEAHEAPRRKPNNPYLGYKRPNQ